MSQAAGISNECTCKTSAPFHIHTHTFVRQRLHNTHTHNTHATHTTHTECKQEIKAAHKYLSVLVFSNRSRLRAYYGTGVSPSLPVSPSPSAALSCLHPPPPPSPPAMIGSPSSSRCGAPLLHSAGIIWFCVLSVFISSGGLLACTVEPLGCSPQTLRASPNQLRRGAPRLSPAGGEIAL